jgi:hypothetical protein
MSQVDPFVYPATPSAIKSDRELAAYFQYLEKFLHDLWMRTGGGDDSTGEIESEASTARSKVVALVSDLGSQLDDLRSEISTVRSLMNAAIAELKDMADESEAKRSPNLAAIYEKLDELEARI